MNQVTKFPDQSTTYHPSGFSEHARRAFGLGQYAPIRAELAALPPNSYERVGVDRALALAIDLATCATSCSNSILDVGCGPCLISELLNACGYAVTGIDRNASPRSVGSLRVIKTELRDFLASETAAFDVVLLLNVLHWIPVQDNELPAEVEELFRRTRSHVYIEVPLSAEEDDLLGPSTLLYPKTLLDRRVATRVHWFATTIATNAKTRRLYRVHVK